jgi:hypothetical protein
MKDTQKHVDTNKIILNVRLKHRHNEGIFTIVDNIDKYCVLKKTGTLELEKTEQNIKSLHHLVMSSWEYGDFDVGDHVKDLHGSSWTVTRVNPREGDPVCARYNLDVKEECRAINPDTCKKINKMEYIIRRVLFYIKTIIFRLDI